VTSLRVGTLRPTAVADVTLVAIVTPEASEVNPRSVLSAFDSREI